MKQTPDNATRREALSIIAAAVWGFAEATVFFVVPDVLLTALVAGQRDVKITRIMMWIGAAVCAAVIGGLVMYGWASANAAAARECVTLVPGISESMRAGVENDLATTGPTAMFTAGWRGVPYKLFAVEAGAASTVIGWFIIASAAARLVRFSATCLVTAIICHTLARRWSPRQRIAATLLVWVIVYIVYVVTLIR